MNLISNNPLIYAIETRKAFIWSRLLRTPFWAIYSLIPFILYRDFHATPLQIAAATAIKPMASLLSVYWSFSINQRRDRLRANIIWANILSVLPFFLFPWVSSPWLIIAAFGWFMFLHRGVMPAWMEVLKLTLPGVSRERLFAYGTTIGYVGDACLPFLIGGLLDGYEQAWRWIFPLTAFISLASVIFLYRISVPPEKIGRPLQPPVPITRKLAEPWIHAWSLVCRRPDFRDFQIGFMLGGAGLMIMSPTFPIFFMDILHLSYTELAIAVAFCKGVGVAMTSRMWADWMNKVDIYRFSACVTFIATLFPLCLIAAQWHIAWLYFAYVIWGVMQGGSELSWNLSGPIFSKDEDSSAYSNVGVLAVGLRGCMAPSLAAILCSLFNPLFVLCLGGLFCLGATERMSVFSRKYFHTARENS
ncbi:MFS transporter [Parachlamydia sp. AcF125]|uniref:MFS transporter n=1 Tax=Parachlamydia sp. AcF125 TaxID=2795736 RepID=UPI001BC984A2|nr:MFS transporter [Parachlamydia sp. AcF125]MBS4168247.1 hypothetical protein [Parachlamydia sp. AcF125]